MSVPLPFCWRHRLSWDLRGLSKAHRVVVQDALNRCDARFYRIRQATGKRVPCTASDLSRFNAKLIQAAGEHVHVHEHGQTGHLLGEPTPVGARAQALGLYWLPTPEHPAGRVELDVHILDTDRALAQEVFLAEAAHAYDYGALTDAQRVQVLALFDYTGFAPLPVGWFEERGEQTYWRWRGERFMGLFMAAFAPGLPRPLEVRQPWQWSYDASDVAAVRAILR